jgi:glycosyltransferase involved in cell wall biosynthesis
VGVRRRPPDDSRPTRVLLIVENISFARDHRLRKQVGSLRKVGYDVTVISPADPIISEDEGVRVRTYRAAPSGTSAMAFVLEYAWAFACTTTLILRELFTRGFNIVQVSGSPDIFFPVMGLVRRLGRRVVFDQRDLAPETYLARYGTNNRVHGVLRWLERRSYLAADRVLVVNESLREVATRRGQLPPDVVTVVGNGPRLMSTAAVRPDPTLKGDATRLVVWAGVMGPQDHLDLAVLAFARVVSDGVRNCRLALLGDGDARAAAERLASDLGIEDQVTFTGWLDEQTTFRYIATADLGIDTNLDEFVSPVKVMEYMAFGLPVAAFDLSETRLLTDGAALLSPAGDASALAASIALLLSDSRLRGDLGALGKAHVENRIAWDRQESAYLSVYRSLGE